MIQNVDLLQVSSSETAISCPQIVAVIVKALDDSAIDSTVFTYDHSVSNDFTTQTNDGAKEGSYDLRLKVYYDGYTNFVLRDFTIVIEDTCKDATLTIGLPAFQTNYKIYDIAMTEHVDPSLITSSETTVPCPSLVIEIVKSAD